MKTKNLAILFILTLVSFITGVRTVSAIEEDLTKIDPNASVLVVYSTEDTSVDENIRLLDLSLGHFAENTDHVSVHTLQPEDLEGKTHLVYYGHIKEELPADVADILSSFEGPMMAMGYNVNQLGEKYSFIQPGEEQVIDHIEYLDDKEKNRETEPSIIFEAILNEEAADAEVFVQASGDQGTFPLIMRNDKNYYYASDALDPPYSVYFSQMLNTFFDAQPTNKKPAYLRLEDVHPLSDPGRLKAAGEELVKRNIPYMISVIPVYTDPVSGKKYHFEDQKEVLNVLQEMQENGGSVVLHGYTHQFRGSETGEGFEFWDVENEMPIYHGPEDDVVKYTEKDFETPEEYEAYMAKNKAFEREYIEDRLTRGVQELANYGIYPLAFEAPHYTLSQHGYEVVSGMFSTYVGQIQLSDERWEIMDTTPYATQPTVLSNLLVLPETLGYVQPDADTPVDDMMKSADYYQVLDGGMMGAFYHPYLGVEGLRELLDEMEKIEDLEWVDLKKINNTVVVDNVKIQSVNGEIKTQINSWGLATTSMDFVYYHIIEAVTLITWIIAWVGIAAVLMFISFTFYQAIRNRRSESYASDHS